MNKYFRVETNSVIDPYIFRDHAWNFEGEHNTNFQDYKNDAPAEYSEHITY